MPRKKKRARNRCRPARRGKTRKPTKLTKRTARVLKRRLHEAFKDDFVIEE